MKKALALMLSLALVLALLCLPASAASDYYSDTAEDHAAVDFADLDLSDFDYSALYAAADALTEACGVKKNEEQVRACYTELIALMNEAATLSTLCDLAYYADVSDEVLSEQSLTESEELIKGRDAVCTALSAMMDSGYKDIMVEDMDYPAYYYSDYEPMTEEESAGISEENELIQQYETLYQDSTASYEDLAEIYLQLLELRKQQAADYGYDSYMEYAYESLYGRDYTPENAETYREYVKAYIVPLQYDIASLLVNDDTYYDLWNLEGPLPEDTLKVLGDHIADVSPELQEAYDALASCHLYDLEASDTKVDMSFTTNLYSIGCPYIFINPLGDVSDYTNLIHEFGHFNEMYHHAPGYLTDFIDYDLSEVNSQGLEMLYLPYASDMVGEDCAEAFVLYKIWDMLSSITEGCLYDEFQQKAFEAENPTVESLTQLFIEVSAQYGYTEDECEYWVDITHNYDSPFYYISYSTSALAALDIYAMSLTDYEGAVDLYLQLSAIDPLTGFLTATEDVGISNIMGEASVAGIADSLYQRYLPGTENADTMAEIASQTKADEEAAAKQAKTKDMAGRIGIVVVVAGIAYGGRALSDARRKRRGGGGQY